MLLFETCIILTLPILIGIIRVLHKTLNRFIRLSKYSDKNRKGSPYNTQGSKPMSVFYLIQDPNMTCVIILLWVWQRTIISPWRPTPGDAQSDSEGVTVTPKRLRHDSSMIQEYDPRATNKHPIWNILNSKHIKNLGNYFCARSAHNANHGWF